MIILPDKITLPESGYTCQQFVRINNRKNFLLEEIPTYYPNTANYKKFWQEQRSYCIDGFWNLDGEHWRWMPPNLYFYVNFGTILHQEKKGEPRTKIRPYLRDVEWEIFYNFALCRGFSGFENDKEYSCDYRLLEDTPTEEEAPELYYNKQLKKFVEPRKYIRALHFYNKGKALYNNSMKNLFIMGSRGFGKSFSVGIGIILHTFIFDFKIDSQSMSKASIEVGVGASLSDKSSELLLKTIEGLNNLPGEHVDKKTGKIFRAPFFKNTTGTVTKPNGKIIHKYKKKIGNIWTEGGTGSKIEHRVFTRENPDAMSGLRPAIIVIEEVGLLENVRDVHGANEAAQKIDQKQGISIYIGTGGNVEKVQESESIFREAKAFDMLEFEDVYEGAQEPICWFIPYHYARNIHKDENGNTDLAKAHRDIMKERKEKMGKKNASNIIDRHLMNFPIVPSEMFLSSKGGKFPLTEINNQLNKIKKNNYYLSNSTNVELFFDNSAKYGVSYVPDLEGKLKPLHEYKRKKEDYENPQGCIVIYEFPDKIENIPNDLYYISYDPYVSEDQDAGTSLGAVYVFKGNNYINEKYGYSQIVAEYVGKPYEGLNYFNENVEKLAMFYNVGNGGIYFEKNKGASVYDYFYKRGKLNLLCIKPTNILGKNKYSRFIEYGYDISNHLVKNRALEYLHDWLLEERGVFEDQVIRNIDLIPSRGLLEELKAYNEFDNFDRVMGFLGSIIAIKDVEINTQTEYKKANAINPLAFLADNKQLFKVNQYVPFERIRENY